MRGGSWLYNLEAYRRLFPPEYAASTFEPERVRLDGTSSWGQLLDFRGFVKPAIRQALLDNIRNLDIRAPWRAFPMRALGAQSAIEHFCQFYGCEKSKRDRELTVRTATGRQRPAGSVEPVQPTSSSQRSPMLGRETAMRARLGKRGFSRPAK